MGKMKKIKKKKTTENIRNIVKLTSGKRKRGPNGVLYLPS